MEIIFFIGLIIIILLLINYKSAVTQNSNQLNKTLSSLKKEIVSLREEIKSITGKEPIIISEKEEKHEQQTISPVTIESASIKTEIAVPNEKKAENSNEQPSKTIIIQEAVEQRQANPVSTPAYSPRVQKESFLARWTRNNPDLEKFIGENLFNKIGIAVLVLGIGFFVKYAIDKNWINEYGRVAIGLLCGIVLVGLAHYLRKNYRSFSSVLAGGGIAVFYFTIAFAFHQYHIINQLAAFIVMLIITIFAVILALLYDRLELGVIATVGGFLTPFIVSTGNGDYITLFSYLIILNIGMLVLSYYKKWPLINILSLFFTVIIYGTWMLNIFSFSTEPPPYSNALIFATVFYCIFLAMNMIHNISRQKAFKAFDFFILLLINFSYFTAGMTILLPWHNGDYKGLFTIGLGAVNFMLAFYFFKKQHVDRNLLYLLIGLTLTFLSLSAPVQLHGHSITLFWCAETVLLFWLFQRSQIALFKYASAFILVLMFFSLMIDWQRADLFEHVYQLPVIFTGIKGIITNLVAVASFTAYHYLLKKEEKDAPYFWGIKCSSLSRVLLVIAIALLYISCYFGVNLYFGKETSMLLPNIYQRIITNLFVLALVATIEKYQPKKNPWLNAGLAITCFIFYFGSGHIILQLRNGVLAGQYNRIHLAMHWVSDLLLLAVFYQGIFIARKCFSELKKNVVFIGWAFSIMLVYMLSSESMHVYVTAYSAVISVSVASHQFIKAGLTIVWGLCSFGMMWLGMRHRYKPLRIISLSLFALALIKLFLFDIRNISEGGKIAAFILLGILLLIVSFMYQRLKKLIIDDEEK